MINTAKCFMVEPVLDDKDLPNETERDWPPHKYILRFRNPVTGEEKEYAHLFGPGAMWYATWVPKGFDWDNEEEPHLYVVCPGDTCWDIDSRASNCTMPNDRIHRCWIRHGTAPNLTVDKNGFTCQAGAGSIQTSNWHGYLRNGELVP